MRASLSLLKTWRPQLVGILREAIRYESRLVACRVCPTHQAVLDEDLCCPEGHEVEYWEVHYLVAGELLAEVVYRASWTDGARGELTKPLQPIPQDCDRRLRKLHYVAETAWRLKRRCGLSPVEAKAEALRRWEQRCQVMS